MTQEEAVQKLKECQSCGDIEIAHLDADNVLCELLKTLGCGDVVSEFEKVRKWYA